MGRKKAEEPTDRTFGIAIRGSKKWRDWVIAFAKFRRLKVTDVIDQALVESADKHGFEKPPPER